MCPYQLLVSNTYLKKNSKDIWSEEEVADGFQYDDLSDPRPQPEQVDCPFNQEKHHHYLLTSVLVFRIVFIN